MPVQNSQDLDARFAVFLNPIRDLTKNWEVDIAKYLEEYLVELSEIQITFDGGETTMNFAEAAMLIQGSATVYSKKVEFLWQMVLQMLDLLSSKRSLESRADNSKGGEGGRHKQVDLFIEFEKVEKLCDGKTINMKDDDEEEEEEMKNSFKFLPEMPLHLVEKESEKSLMKIVLYLKNKETFGNKDDFRINRSYLTPSGLLYLDLPPEILKNQMHGENIIEPSADDSIAGFLHAEDEMPASQNILLGVEGNMSAMQEEMEDFMGNDNFDNLGQDDDHHISPEMPAFDPPENVEIGKNIISAEFNEDCEKLDTGRSGKYGLRIRDVPKEIPPRVKLTEPLKPLEPHVETPAKRPIRAGRIRKPLPCMCHREPTKAKRNRKSKDDVPQDRGDKILPSVESFITRDLANLISNNNNDIKNKVVDSRLLEEQTSEESKRQEKCKKKKVKELMNEENNLTLEEIKVRLLEEAQQQNRVEDKLSDDVYDDHILDLDLDLGGGDDDDLAMPNPHNNDVFDKFDRLTGSGHNGNLNDSALYEPGSDYEALVQKWVSDYVASAQEHIASSELTRRVNKWRKIITPKLQEEEERQAFDIHSYGSHILDHFPDNCPDNILFDEVAHGKSNYEVSRLFLSCLMLANTYNIELSQTQEGDLEMDCLQLKLLSKVRHHKEMEENLPPSVKKKKSKQDKRKKQVSSDDENSADNISSISADEYYPVSATNKNSKAKKLKVTENNPNV